MVDHDGESESRMLFGLRHDHLRRLILIASWPVPVDDDAGDSAADHVIDLIVYLRGIKRTITDVHVAGLAEPDHQVSI